MYRIFGIRILGGVFMVCACHGSCSSSNRAQMTTQLYSIPTLLLILASYAVKAADTPINLSALSGCFCILSNQLDSAPCVWLHGSFESPLSGWNFSYCYVTVLGKCPHFLISVHPSTMLLKQNGQGKSTRFSKVDLTSKHKGKMSHWALSGISTYLYIWIFISWLRPICLIFYCELDMFSYCEMQLIKLISAEWAVLCRCLAFDLLLLCHGIWWWQRNFPDDKRAFVEEIR